MSAAYRTVYNQFLKVFYVTSGGIKYFVLKL